MTIDSLPQLGGIYLITCKTTGKTYIGSTQNVYKRVRQHRCDLRKKRHANIYLQHAWDKYGEDDFSVTVLELCVKSRLLECEDHWFSKYHIGDLERSFNISKVPGAPMAGLKHKADTLVKMSKAQTGRKHTEETKRRMSEVAKGKQRTAEHQAKINAANKGRKASEETRAKLREVHKNPSPELRYKMGNSMRGKKMKPESLEKIFNVRAQNYVITAPDGTEYHIKGLAKFCREHNLDQGSMSHVMRGRQKTYKGWLCRRDE